MDKLVWNEKLNIGVEVVDKAHANLFRIAGKLLEQITYESNYQNACKKGLEYLEEYTMKHFSEEEAYMRSIRYRGYEKHKKIHDTFRDQTLISLKKTLEASGYSHVAAQRFLGTLLGWLTGHIMTEDQAITGELPTEKLFAPSFRTSTAAQAVSQALQNVFHIDAPLVDADYHGQNLGTGLYCRLCYDMDKGGKVQLLLGVEERLIRRGVGLLLGLPAMQDTELVHDASLQIFEQFLHHISKLFDSDVTYHLSKEELLTRDEFRSDFMTRYPCSLKFETRLGDFVFCARKWKARKRKSDNFPEMRASLSFTGNRTAGITP